MPRNITSGRLATIEKNDFYIYSSGIYDALHNAKPHFFNTENRVEFTECTDARKYAILSAHNYAFCSRKIRIYSEFAAYRCINIP